VVTVTGASRADAVRKILNRRWQRPILQALADRPLRYSEVGKALIARVGDRPGDGHLSEELRRLRGLGLIDKRHVSGARHERWVLTEHGNRTVSVLDKIARAQPFE
jgi:DNA-binding HxlR family transcriptional regulator